MSTTYKTREFDTFLQISARVYGTDEHASLIQQSNPGSAEPFIAGIILTIPDIQGAPKNLPQKTVANNEDEISILINGVRFRFWTQIIFKSTLDSIDTFDFVAPFDQESAEFRETFKPFSFPSVVVSIGGVPLFNGTMVAVNPLVDTDGKRVSISCYSLPGVLGDCTPPVSAYPMQYEGLHFNEIADRMVSTFGINILYEADVGETFIQGVACGVETKVLWFLNSLAKKRNGILTNNNEGDLVFKQSIDSGKPVAKLQQGLSPLISAKPKFNPQKYYSHVSGVDPLTVEAGGNFGTSGGSFTVNNPFLNIVNRPLTFKADDFEGSNIQLVVRTRIARMFANAASYEVSISTWRDNSGNLWEPNTIIQLISPDAMIYKEHDFVVRNVSFVASSSERFAMMNVVLPGAFSAKIPESLPWE